MKVFFSLFLIILLSNCSKPKTVLICGDHICVNKNEAEQFFEKNLSLEVKIIDKKIKKEVNLIELNLKKDDSGARQVSVSSKTKTSENLKTLSKTEIKDLKRKLKKINKEKDEKQIVKNDTSVDLKNYNNDKKKEITKIKIKQNNVSKKRDMVDVCTLLEKCSIEEISKYLIKQGRKKDFPDLTIRQ